MDAGKKKKIMVVLSASGESEKAVDYAVGLAKEEGATLLALFMLDSSIAADALERFTDIGFIGDKPSTRLSEAMMKDYRQRGYEDLGRVQVKAMEEGVGFEPLLKEGDYLKKTLEVIEEEGVDVAVVAKKKGGPLARYFSKSRAEELKKRAPCTVIVFEE